MVIGQWAFTFPLTRFNNIKNLLYLLTSLVAQMVKHLPTIGRLGFYPWVRKMPWIRKWQLTPVLLPGKSHGWRSVVGYSPWGCYIYSTFLSFLCGIYLKQISLQHTSLKRMDISHNHSGTSTPAKLPVSILILYATWFLTFFLLLHNIILELLCLN